MGDLFSKYEMYSANIVYFAGMALNHLPYLLSNEFAVFNCEKTCSISI